MLATVVLSIALFLLGIAGVRRRYRVQTMMIAFAALITVAATVQIVAVLA